MALPRFIVVKSDHNSKYLCYTKDEYGDAQNAPDGFLTFCGEKAGSHYAKYEIEMAKGGGNKGLIHIRSCYNNKYWVSVKGTDKLDGEDLILAAADQPEEDQSNPSCTLFEHVYVDRLDHDDQDELEDDSHMAQFRHVHLGRFTSVHNTSEALVLLEGSSTSTNVESRDVCTVTNWESLVILPKHVAFKGDDGNYLLAQMVPRDWVQPWGRNEDDDQHADAFDSPYLNFNDSDINDPAVANEIFTNADGTMQIKNTFFERYWRLAGDEWISADGFNPTARDKNYKDTLFHAIRVRDKVIALVSLGNNNYCKRYRICEMNGLRANVPNLSIHSHLRVEEPVTSRTVYNVNYRLTHARTYNYQNGIEIATGEAVNFTGDTTTVHIKLMYNKLKSAGCWDDVSRVCSMKSKTSIEAPGIPRIATDENGSMRVEISGGEFKGEVKWGDTEEVEAAAETVCVVAVPAMSVVKVRLLATKAWCDVPFSYSRRDTRINGEVHVFHDLDDGVYTGVTFDFKYDTKGEKL